MWVVMRYKEKWLNNLVLLSESDISKIKFRMNNGNFTRNRKMPFKNVVYYNLNKKGLTSKMEIVEFNEIINCADISSPAVLKQREKLNADIYKEMQYINLKDFYNDYKDEVKLFKGYILTATDGSDFEIPNTNKTRVNYNSTKNNSSVARAHVSNSFDVLNHFVLSTIIGPENADEKEMDIQNLNEIKNMNLPYPIIRVKDRGYVSLKDIYYSKINNDKFVVRLKKSDFRKQVADMKTNDEIITIPYQYDRVRYYKDKDFEFYNLLEESKMDIKVRCIKIILSNGETEILITNLSKEEVSTEDMKELYNLRWQIELNYHVLKESLKIELITSSKENLIKQDIYSQMVAFNLLQAFINDEQESIDQKKYKHEMKININMAVGFYKKFLLYIMIEEDKNKKHQLLETLGSSIKSYLVPIRKDRQYPRKKDKKNKYSINKRKSF